MTLKEFRTQIEKAEKGKVFDHGISDPFSWRGLYDEVAFTLLLNQQMTKEEILYSIDKAYNNVFHGWKGGDFYFNDHTDVHFEATQRDYTDGGYCAEMIAEIEGGAIYKSQEMRLTKLAFS